MKLTFLPPLILTFLLLSCGFLHAKKYYKHVDENGITHYSDKPPTDIEEFESWQVRAEDTEYELKVVNRGTQRAPAFFAINPYHGPIEVGILFTYKSNVVAKPNWPARYVVPANSELFLSKVKPIDRYKAWSFEYSISSTLGDPAAIHDSNHAYRLPFIGNKNFFVSQAYNGEFTHQGEQNQYAIDIVMPEGIDIQSQYRGLLIASSNQWS